MRTLCVTRVRLRFAVLVPAFLLLALRARREAERSPGFRAGALITDTGRAYWTVTLWDTEDALRACHAGPAHRALAGKLGAWCDEAAQATWSQAGDAVPTARELSDGLLAGAAFIRLPWPSRAHEAGKAMPLTEVRRLAMRPRRAAGA